jgi:H+/gluconate symporter-like permease
MARRRSRVAWKQDRAWNIGAISGIASTELAASETSLSSPAPAFLAQGVNSDHLHRAVAISSGVLDSLPYNGYVVTTIRAICNETHRDAYGAVGALTVIVPGLGVLLCLGSFALEV